MLILKDFAIILRRFDMISFQQKLTIFLKIAQYHTKQAYPYDIVPEKRFFSDLSDNEEDQYVLSDVDEHNTISESNNDEDTHVLSASMLELSSNEDIWHVLLNIITTPRTLKHVIRDLDAAWKQLHGECDYMELLILTILRWSDVPIFDFIRENLTVFRLHQKTSKEQIKAFITNNNFSEQDLLLILDKLFPKEQPGEYARRICNTKSVIDYFSRILKKFVPEYESDQKQLKAIYNWNSGDKNQDIIDIIVNTNEYNINLNKRWLRCLNDNTLLKLTEEVIKRFLDRYDSFFPLVLMSQQWYPYRTSHWHDILEPWYKNIFDIILPRNMSLSASVYYNLCLTHNIGNRYYGIHSKYFEDIREKVIGWCKQKWNTFDVILDTCIGTDINVFNSLRCFVMATCHKNINDSEQVFDILRASDWQWLTPVLLEGLQQKRENRSKIYCIISNLIFRSNSCFPIIQENIPIRYDEIPNYFFTNIFRSDQQQELMQLLSDDVEPIEALTLENIKEISTNAKQWQKNHPQ
jgi:hypothetical protein